MSKKVFYSLILFLSVNLLLTSCSDDDPDKITLESSNVEVVVGEEVSIKINSGNGGYEVTSDKAETATASLKDRTITIKGVAEGTTTLTVTDKEGEKATISVKVVADLTPDAVGIYWGELKVKVDEVESTVPGAEIELEKIGGNKVKLVLENFSFDQIQVGDIVVEDIKLTKDGDILKLADTTVTKELAEGVISAKISITSSQVEGDNLILSIGISDIKIGGEAAGFDVAVTFDGDKGLS